MSASSASVYVPPGLVVIPDLVPTVVTAVAGRPGASRLAYCASLTSMTTRAGDIVTPLVGDEAASEVPTDIPPAKELI